MAPANSANGREEADPQIVLGILEAIDRGDKVTQRAVANELGVALGLVNAYLKRCMKKGWVKMRSAPTRRYAYYLTPQGFTEKSKLTANYLAYSFSFFRTARADCEKVLAEAVARRMKRVALVGASELSEIIMLCAADLPLEIVGIVDARKAGLRHAGFTVVAQYEQLADVDGMIVSDVAKPMSAYDAAVLAVGADRVLAPALLRTSPRPVVLEAERSVAS
jgi:DNA-binding MarR family transcriptional regulator